MNNVNLAARFQRWPRLNKSKSHCLMESMHSILYLAGNERVQ